jgi:cytochrome c-type biogenesis protein CcmH
MKCALLIAATLAFAVTAALAQTGPEKLADPAREARAVALQKEFRCLVCQGESLDESGAPLAADLRRLIRARIEAGDTNAQIERYLATRYGDFILMKPPLEPQTYALWFGPIIILAIGGGVAALVVFRARRKPKGSIP